MNLIEQVRVVEARLRNAANRNIRFDSDTALLCEHGIYGADIIRDLVTALEAAEKCEPHAWETFAIKFANGKQLSYDKPENLPKYIGVRPLYLHPPQLPELTDEMRESYKKGHNDGVAHHKKATEQQAKDAARYRWLRERVYKDGGSLSVEVINAYDLYAIGHLQDGLDQAIDTAMEAAK